MLPAVMSLTGSSELLRSPRDEDCFEDCLFRPRVSSHLVGEYARSVSFPSLPPERSCNHIAVTAGRDNINVDLEEVQWGGVDWICVTSGRDMRMILVNTLMNFRHT